MQEGEESIEERLLGSQKEDSGQYELIGFLEQDLEIPLSYKEVKEFLGKKQAFYFHLKRQGKETPVQEVEDAFKERGESDKELIMILCSEYFSNLDNGEFATMKFEKFEKVFEEVKDYCNVLKLYGIEVPETLDNLKRELASDYRWRSTNKLLTEEIDL